MKKKSIITKLPLNIVRLKKALKDEKVAIALDVVEEIRSEKKSKISEDFLKKIEKHLLFILNYLQATQKNVKTHFKKLDDMISFEMEKTGVLN